MTGVPLLYTFHVMRNTIIPGTEGLLQNFTKALYDVGGRVVDIERPVDPSAAATRVSVLFGSAALTLEVNIALAPPRSRSDALRMTTDAPPLFDTVIAPFLSPPVRDEFAKAGWSYWDMTGNLRIQRAEPTVWIDRVGASRDPEPDVSIGAQRLRSLKGRAASEVIVELLDSGGATSVRQLTRETKTGLGTASRVIDLLRAENLIDVAPTGIGVPDRIALARRWTLDYGFRSTFKPTRYTSLLGEDIAFDRLRRTDLRVALTGSRAAAAEYARRSLVTPLPASGMWLYTDNVRGLERELDLAPETRGNILVAECEFLASDREGRQEGSPPLARSWRIVGDLLAGGGRLASVGEDLADLLVREALSR